MESVDIICMWIAEIVPLSATLFSFIYGLKIFFKKGKPLFLQSITMAMGCHALGSIYHLCQTLTTETVLEGFTPAYLGRIGFFLFFIAASYGQMDRIVDDGTKKIRPSRYIALAKFLLYTLYPEDYSEWEVEQFKKEFEGFDINMVYETHIWQKIASIFNL